MIPVLENFGLLSMIIIFLLVGVGLLEGIRSSVLAAAVEFTGSREGTTLGFAFTLMDGIGAFGALLAGWAAGIQFSHAFLLAGILCTFSLILCFSVSLVTPVRHTQSDKTWVKADGLLGIYERLPVILLRVVCSGNQHF